MPAAGTDRPRPAKPVCPLSASASLADWKREDERRAPAFLALAPDLAGQPLDDQTDQVDAQSRAFRLDRVNVVHPVELLEQPTERGLGNPDAAVGDRPPRRGRIVAVDADGDLAAARRVLERVRR